MIKVNGVEVPASGTSRFQILDLGQMVAALEAGVDLDVTDKLVLANYLRRSIDDRRYINELEKARRFLSL